MEHSAFYFEYGVNTVLSKVQKPGVQPGVDLSPDLLGGIQW